MDIQWKPKKNRYLYSENHVTADDLCKLLFDKKHFPTYLGLAKRYDKSYLLNLAKQISDDGKIAMLDKAKIFMWNIKNK